MTAERGSGVMRRRLAALALAGLGAFAATATAQVGYPDRPVRIVSGFAVGGSVDYTVRLMAEQLSKRFPNNFIVDMRTGANGFIAAGEVAKSKPDGYTLMLGYDGTLTVAPNLTTKTPFDPVKDFQPISKLVNVPIVIAAHPSVGARNIRDLVELSKAKPGTLFYGTGGHGSTLHLAGELLSTKAGLKWTHVPYKGGGPAVVDAIAGTTPLIYASLTPLLPFLKTGKLVGIGIGADSRSTFAPDIPTFKEHGVASGNVVSWYSLVGPAGMPAAIVDKLNAEIHAILRQPDVIEKFNAQGLEVAPSTPQQLGEEIKSDLARWKQVVSDAKITITDK
jgi:tripartite-type tricarboxylate transporter receptor subunit TctC